MERCRFKFLKFIFCSSIILDRSKGVNCLYNAPSGCLKFRAFSLGALLKCDFILQLSYAAHPLIKVHKSEFNF